MLTPTHQPAVLAYARMWLWQVTYRLVVTNELHQLRGVQENIGCQQLMKILEVS